MQVCRCTTNLCDVDSDLLAKQVWVPQQLYLQNCTTLSCLLIRYFLLSKLVNWLISFGDGWLSGRLSALLKILDSIPSLEQIIDRLSRPMLIERYPSCSHLNETLNCFYYCIGVYAGQVKIPHVGGKYNKLLIPALSIDSSINLHKWQELLLEGSLLYDISIHLLVIGLSSPKSRLVEMVTSPM